MPMPFTYPPGEMQDRYDHPGDFPCCEVPLDVTHTDGSICAEAAAHEAHIAAIGGRCSHGGHGWEGTCSDITDALASPGAMHRGGCTSDAPPLECPVCA